jgi:hypothetical protein
MLQKQKKFYMKTKEIYLLIEFANAWYLAEWTRPTAYMGRDVVLKLLSYYVPMDVFEFKTFGYCLMQVSDDDVKKYIISVVEDSGLNVGGTPLQLMNTPLQLSSAYTVMRNLNRRFKAWQVAGRVPDATPEELAVLDKELTN